MSKWNITLVLLLIGFVANAQRFKDEKGNLSVLSGQTEVNIEFTYSNLRLMKDNFTEQEYVANRIEYLNKKNKNEGDYWLNSWNAAKKGIWEPNFMKLLDRTITSERGISFKQPTDSARKYTLIVDAVWIYPGWDAGIMKQPAKVTTTLRIVETENRDNVLYEVKAIEAPGDQWGSNFNDESRIGEGFEKTAKSFGKLMIKRVK